MKAKRMISLMTVMCILAALLMGCSGGETETVAQAEPQTVVQNAPQEKPQQEPADMPEMQNVEIGEETIAALVQAGLEAVAEESEL